MAIELQTGLPGHGKTLYTLWRVRKWAEKENRQVYYNGIPDLMIPGWIELQDATKWMECPPNSIIVIDEAQRVFRPRSNGSQVPEHVSKLETHRHGGLDLVLITQHPMLIDGNVRKLTDKHRHCIRPFGSKYATVHAWAGVRDQCDKAGARKESIKEQFAYPKEVYSWYKSAEVHTVKRSIPTKFLLVFLLPVLLGVAIWYAYHWTQTKVHPDALDKAQALPVGSVGPGLGVSGGPPGQAQQQHLNLEDWAKLQQPRIAGLPHTAPIYDQVTQPVQAPVPAACVQSRSKGCRCYSQQGTVIDTGEALCKSIVEKGFYVAWQQPQTGAVVQAGAERSAGGAAQRDAVPYAQAPSPASQLVIAAVPSTAFKAQSVNNGKGS